MAKTNLLEGMTQRARGAVEFVKDVRKELNNVSWPSRSELTGTTIVVIVAVFFFGFFLWIVDQMVGPGMQFILRSGRP